jgi:enoyl-[acyl-carrier-protein] reductase (NADH)
MEKVNTTSSETQPKDKISMMRFIYLNKSSMPSLQRFGCTLGLTYRAAAVAKEPIASGVASSSLAR